MDNKAIALILDAFQIDLKKASYQSINQGYINDTFLISNANENKYILQRVNSSIFKNVEGLHDNINTALHKLKGNDYKEISLIPTKKDEQFHKVDNDYWRLITFVNNSIAHNFTTSPEIAFQAGKLLGTFHKLLNNEDSTAYVVTLKHLNYLPFRIEEFKDALKNSLTERLKFVEKEIDFANANMYLFNAFYSADLPLRVCHNDTKLNNLLFDKTTQKGLCFIDLDTIMAGYFHYDFGDLVRTVVSESKEDEMDLNKIKFNLDLFRNFINGLKPFANILSEKEIEFLPISCALLPFMHGLRALTDYLNGNIHYKVTYETQNLDRCKSLFAFTRLALINQEMIAKIIQKQLNSPY
jgi:Ser/Thr protein kinase RdoA (MazF antagonist)